MLEILEEIEGIVETEMPADEARDEEALWQLIHKLEDEMCAEGIPPDRRHFDLPIRAMEALGFKAFITGGAGVPPILERIRAMHGSLFRRKDVAVGGVHGGAFMFRGIATKVDVPVFFGTVEFDPYELCDLSDRQIKWLRSNSQHDRAYLLNFCNLFDFAACLVPMGGYGSVPERARSMLRLSAFQTQCAAATLCASFDERGAVQSALLAAELSMKAALKGAGAEESELKDIGHDLEQLARTVGGAYAMFEVKEAIKLAGTLPELVPNRYSEEQPNRNTTGEIVVASQAIGGMVARALTGGSLWKHISKQISPAP